jgi:WD40 repeat protein
MLKIVATLRELYGKATGEMHPREEPKAAELLADGLNNQAVSMLDLGRKEDAIKCWQKALEGSQTHLEATYNLSLIKWRDAEIADDEVLRRLDNCGNNPEVEKEKLAELKAFIHAEGFNHEAAKEILKGIPGKYDALFSRKDTDRIGMLRTMKGHTGSVNSVAVTPDGRYAISGSGDKTLRVWELETGQCIRTIEGHTFSIDSVAVTPDGRYAVSGSWDKTLKLWEIKTGRCVNTLKGHTQ